MNWYFYIDKSIFLFQLFQKTSGPQLLTEYYVRSERKNMDEKIYIPDKSGAAYQIGSSSGNKGPIFKNSTSYAALKYAHCFYFYT